MTGDITTSAGKPLRTAAGKGAILVKRMSEALTAARAHCAGNKYRPHPEERRLRRVSKDGRMRLWLILRDAAQERGSSG
jgi:hypothetical protein